MRGLLVLKVGTKNLMTGGRLDQDIFDDIARQVVTVEGQGKKILIVSSGAIQAGRERMEDFGFGIKHFNKKDLAGIGARHLLNKWGGAFAYYSREISQFWLTFANWNDIEEIKSIKTGIFNCLENNVTPVVNENDIISDTEILFMEKGFSENDRLARMVASLAGAEGVLFLTDVGGVFEDDPRINPQARMYEEFNPFSFKTGKLSDVSSLGRGGIKTKIEEAKGCFLSGMKVSIAGMEKDVLIKFSRGEAVGTKLSKFSRFKQ